MNALNDDARVLALPPGESEAIEREMVDRVIRQVQEEGVDLLGPNGVLRKITKRILEKALEAEMSDHLGYERGARSGWGTGNNRNGTSAKTALTDAGDFDLDIPRDRNSTFEPKLIAKHQRRLTGFNEIIIGLLSRGMTVRDIQDQIKDMYDVDISHDLVSKITDSVLPELAEWQSRPLDTVYPILFLDAIQVKVRDNNSVRNKAIHIALGVNREGEKHVLGMWIERTEGAKFWMSVLTELKNRGVHDFLIICTDGLTGFPDAIEAIYPQSRIQTCVVHLIRGSLNYCSYKDRGPVAKALKPIYQAATVDAAQDALDTFELEWGDRYAAIVNMWRAKWEYVITFLDFPPEIRKVIYTTNAIEVRHEVAEQGVAA